MSELKNCPFCGGGATESYSHAFIRCENKECSIFEFWIPEHNWNTRFTTPPSFEPFKGPFRYEGEYEAAVFDSNNQRVLELRGHGFLVGRGSAMKMTDEEAAKIQDRIGIQLAALMNGESTT